MNQPHTDKLRVAVIGHGWAASAHIAAINQTGLATVTTICSSRPLDAKELSQTYGCEIRTTTDYSEVLTDPSIDVVDITGLPATHARQFIQAAEAGKHIIVEKPIAMNLADCEAMAAAADKAGVKTCVCFEVRYSAQLQVTKAMLDEGLLGDVHYAEVDYYHGIGPWYGQFRWNTQKQNGGSALLTAGCHALDALLMLMGTDVEEVTSYSTRSSSPVFEPYEYATASTTLLKFRSGKVAKCAAVVDCLQPYYFRTHLIGSEGSLLDNKFHSTKLRTDKAQWSHLAFPMLDSGDVKDHPYQTQFHGFFTAVREGRQMPLTSLHDALQTFRVLFAADESATLGRPVRL